MYVGIFLPSDWTIFSFPVTPSTWGSAKIRAAQSDLNLQQVSGRAPCITARLSPADVSVNMDTPRAAMMTGADDTGAWRRETGVKDEVIYLRVVILS